MQANRKKGASRALIGFICVFLSGSLPLPAAAPSGLGDRPSWPVGETLKYQVSWGLLLAAEATYTAQPASGQPGNWDLALDLQTRGPVDTFYPVRLAAHSLLQASPWRSRKLVEKREEDGEKFTRTTTMDYAARKCLVVRVPGTFKKTYPLPADTVTDGLAAFYGLRSVAWAPGVTRTFLAWDEDETKTIEAVFAGKETIVSTASSQKTPCLVIWAKPIYNNPKKDKLGLGAKVWLSDDAFHRPIRVDLKLKFGTIRMDLVRETPARKS